MTNNKSIGQLLIEAGLISSSQIQLAEREHQQSDLEISEILVARGWLKQETIDFFAQRWSEMLTARSKKPLPFYFKEAGLLNVEQINEILKLQKQSANKVRFHRLAVEEGYLNQSTVDFFLAHMFNVHDPKTTMGIPPHELIRNYARGKKEFSNIDLRSISLMGASLSGIILDGSNLRSANLSKANLNGSNLIRVNLNLANLTQTVLTEANLSRSFLKQANLQSAHLGKANFSGADLTGANLQSAYLAKANFSGADLTGVNLPANCPYEIYYDSSTIFEQNFNPTSAGWKIRVSARKKRKNILDDQGV
ncbi:MAG: pentapeptide repeat-containing protein [Cyanobacteria bacterium J06607_15]